MYMSAISPRFIIKEPFNKSIYKKWDTVIATKMWVITLWSVDWITYIDWYFDYFVAGSRYTEKQLQQAYKDILSRT